MRYYSGIAFLWAGLALGLVVLSPWLFARGRFRRMLARDAAPALLAMLLSYPALTLAFSWGLGREQIRSVQLAGLACTFAGALWTARLSLARGDGPVEAPIPA